MGAARDGEPVAVFDTKGIVHTAEGWISLKRVYARINRNLTQTIAYALGDLLPSEAPGGSWSDLTGNEVMARL